MILKDFRFRISDDVNFGVTQDQYNKEIIVENDYVQVRCLTMHEGGPGLDHSGFFIVSISGRFKTIFVHLCIDHPNAINLQAINRDITNTGFMIDHDKVTDHFLTTCKKWLILRRLCLDFLLFDRWGVGIDEISDLMHKLAVEKILND